MVVVSEKKWKTFHDLGVELNTLERFAGRSEATRVLRPFFR